jgi:hypothetical protein
MLARLEHERLDHQADSDSFLWSHEHNVTHGLIFRLRAADDA